VVAPVTRGTDAIADRSSVAQTAGRAPPLSPKEKARLHATLQVAAHRVLGERPKRPGGALFDPQRVSRNAQWRQNRHAGPDGNANANVNANIKRFVFEHALWKKRSDLRAGLDALAGDLANPKLTIELRVQAYSEKTIGILKQELARRNVQASVIVTDGTRSEVVSMGRSVSAVDPAARAAAQARVQEQWNDRRDRLLIVLEQPGQNPKNAHARDAVITVLRRDGLSAKNYEAVLIMLEPFGLTIPAANERPSRLPPLNQHLSPEARRRIESLNPEMVRFSQDSVRSLIGPTEQIRQHGGLNAVQVVRMPGPEGEIFYVAFDNTRTTYARLAKMPAMPVIIRGWDEKLPSAHRSMRVQANDRGRVNDMRREHGLSIVQSDGTLQLATYGEAVAVRCAQSHLPPGGTDDLPRVRDTKKVPKSSSDPTHVPSGALAAEGRRAVEGAMGESNPRGRSVLPQVDAGIEGARRKMKNGRRARGRKGR
jgi:hypothetical protein